VQIHVIPDWQNFLLQLLNTVLMFLFVKHFAWGHVHKLIAQRKEIATAEMNEAQSLKASVEELHHKATEEIGNAKNEARTIIEKSKQVAEAMKDDIVHEAKEKALRTLKRAEEEILLTEKKAAASLKEETVHLAMESAKRLLQKEISPETHRELFREMLSEVGEVLE